MKFAQMPKDTDVKCLNCGSMINTSNTFCQTCGQKIKDYRLSAWILIKEVFSSIFNLDSKFAKTLLNIWRPVKLTKAYVAGERKRYLNPGRLFIVSFFLLSAMFSFYLKKINIDKVSLGEQTGSAKDFYMSDYRQEMMATFDSLTQLHSLTPAAQVDSIRYKMFLSSERMNADSIPSPGAIFEFGSNPNDSVTLEVTAFKKDYKLATKDVLELEKEDLFEKYKVHGFFDQLYLVQYLKFRQNPNGWIIFMISNSLWSIVLSTFLLALFMNLLYIRRYYYYVEHLVFLMNFQSLWLIIGMSMLLLAYINNTLAISMLPFLLGIGSIWFVVSLKRYYQQSLFKTILKSFLISIAHVMLLSIFLLIVVIASFALY